jgi:hypothetical protein
LISGNEKDDHAKQEGGGAFAADAAQQGNQSTDHSCNTPQPEEGLVPDVARFILNNFLLVWGYITIKRRKIIACLRRSGELIMAIATVALFGVAVLQWVTFEKQWKTFEKTDDTLSAANRTNQGINRSFIYFDGVSGGFYPSPPTVFAVTTNIINSGLTPARNVKIKFDCKRRMPDQKPTLDPFYLAKWDQFQFDPPTFIGPRQIINSAIVCELPVNVFDQVRQGAEWFILAEAAYYDVFDPHVLRITRMTKQIRADQSGGGRFGFAGRHNCADEDCPKY